MVLVQNPKDRNNKKLSKKLMPTLFFTPSSTSPSSPSSPVTPRQTFSASMIEEDIENVELIIKEWEHPTNSMSITKVNSIFNQNREEAREFLRSVKALNRAMHHLVSRDPGSDKLVLAQNLMQFAMNRMEKEFCLILSEKQDQLDPESVSGKSSDGSSSFHDEIGLEEDYMSNLKLIADCMISSGYSQECFKAYKLTRKSIVEEGLYILGIERYRTPQVSRMSWKAQDRMIRNWVKAVKVAVRRLFSGEKALCDSVFSGSQRIGESCFLEIMNEAAVNLFRFPEIIAKARNSPERIFVLLDLYETVSLLWPEIQSIFDSELTSGIKMQALSSLLQLGQSVRDVLLDFEATIQKDSSKDLVPGGGVHQLTKSVMDYLSSLADYDGVLSEIVADGSLPEQVTLPKSYFDSPTSDDSSPPAVPILLARLVLALLCKLDIKSRVYKDTALSYLFLANNLQHVLEKVCTSRLRILFGEDWLFKQAARVINNATNYERVAWTKVLSTLPYDNSSLLSPEEAKETFLKFNSAFEETYRKQDSWIVPDRRLRDELKVSISRNVISVYREFYDKHAAMFRPVDNVKFAPDDLQNYLSDLFHGVLSVSGSSSSSSSSCSSTGCIPHYNSS